MRVGHDLVWKPLPPAAGIPPVVAMRQQDILDDIRSRNPGTMTATRNADDDTAAAAGETDYRPHHHKSVEGSVLAEALDIRDVIVPYQEELDKIAEDNRRRKSDANATLPATIDPPPTPGPTTSARTMGPTSNPSELGSSTTRGMSVTAEGGAMTPYDLDSSSSSSDNDEGWNPSREVMRIALRSNLNITTHDRRPIDKAATLQALEQKEELLRSELESRPDRVDPGNGPPSARTPSAARSQQDCLKSLTQQRESEADILEAIRRGYQDDIQRRTASRIDSIKGQARKKRKGKKRQTERASFLKGGTKRREPPSYGAGKIGPPPPPAPTLMMDDGGATTNTTRRRPQPRFPEPYDTTCLVAPLHSDATAGVDTCSGYSVSTYAEDFATLDTSPEACGSVSIKGIGSSDQGSTTGGRGAMAIPCLDAYDGRPGGGLHQERGKRTCVSGLRPA
jgi:hypothetical protein